MDGPGPWCDERQNYPVRSVDGVGSFETVAGTAGFELKSENVQMAESPLPLFGDSYDRGTVDMRLATETNTLVVHYSFDSEFGKTLTIEQKQAMFNDRSVPYSETFAKLYTSVKCSAQRSQQ